VTIYRGIPEDVAGIDLKEEEEVTTLEVTEIPQFLRDDVEAGISAESIDEARSRVDVLEQRAADKEFEGRDRKRRK
jgi:hypothetical protein